MPELTAKDLLKTFKAASWRDSAELNGQIQILPTAIDSKTIAQMLDILCNKRLATDTVAQSKRLKVFRRVTQEVEDKNLFGVFVKAFKAGDRGVREALLPIFPRINNYEAHSKLAALLKSPDADLRRASAMALERLGGKNVVRVVNKLMDERDFVGRNEAMDLLVRVAGHLALPALRTTLEFGKQPEKIKALRLLGDEKLMAKARSTALRTMVGALEDESENVVLQAIMSFSALCNEDDYFEFIAPRLDSSRVHVVKAAVNGLRRFSSPRALAALTRKLQAGPNIVRMEVLDTLEALGTDEILPALVEALGHKNITIRQAAQDVLGRLTQRKTIDVARTIIWLLHSRDVNVRRMAVEIARKVKDPDDELWPRLLRFLRDEDWWVRERVMDALVEIAGLKLTPHMVGFLEDPNDVVRRFAVDVLARLKDEKALGALISSARADTDWWVREKSVEAIADVGDQRAIPYLVDLMRKESEIQFVCIEALSKIDARQSAPYVAEMLDSEDADVRLAAVKCLGSFGAVEYSEKLQPLLLDADRSVSAAAQERLMHWNIELSDHFVGSRDKAVSFLDRMLIAVVDAGADDLILASQRRPMMKRIGKTTPISQTVLTHDQVTSLITPHLSTAQLKGLDDLKDADFSYEILARGERFRVNVFKQETGFGAVFRTIKGDLPALEKLGLPEIVKGFGDLRHGLVLVGGPTGSGKSTTLAAIIDYINGTSGRHVISIEDPIEVIHSSRKGLVNQREVGAHTQSFSAALRSTLREDPDVILIGEMRDLVTISFAVNAAETGHLVFGTVHTVSADTSVDRLINAFPPREQPQVRSTLAENLRAVTCQYLLRRRDKPGRVLASEVMLNNDAVANLIRQGKTYQIPSIVATSRDIGMMSMDNELMRLFKAGVISAEDAYMKANTKKDFEEIVGDDVPVEGAPAVTNIGDSTHGKPTDDAPKPPERRPDGRG